ncbi:MAG: aldehyde:ferredoxin oxidoreductase, partial [Deltaproteobacteria bacterium]|nr:aldehyde:ferredoxin oxidoreductase [Deltaproteobacteria bacterium]
FALKMGQYLNRMGLDSLSAGETIGWAMECVEKGIFDKNDFDGLDFTWGNTQTVEKILDLIITQKGVGADFAKGTRHLAGKMGKGSEKYAMHVKGLDIICGDPRGIKAFGLTYAIASRGGDHLRAEPFFELTNRFDEAKKRFGTRDAADRLSDNGKAALVEYSERQSLLTDCLTMCKNVGLSMDVLDFELAADLLTAGTGLKFTENVVNKSLRQTIDNDRLLNIDFGITSKEDTLPHRFTNEPLLEGESKNQVVPVHDMVKEYYKIKGWDKNGVPPKP